MSPPDKYASAPSQACRDLEPLLPILRDGELSDEETTRVQAHLEICPWCRRELEAYEAIDQAVAKRFAVQMSPERALKLRELIAGWLSPDATSTAPRTDDLSDDALPELAEDSDLPEAAASDLDDIQDAEEDCYQVPPVNCSGSSLSRIQRATPASVAPMHRVRLQHIGDVMGSVALATLENPDDSAMTSSHEYSPLAAWYLSNARRLLRDASHRSWLQAHRLAARCLSRRSAQEQRLQALFIASRASALLGDAEQACAYVDDALDLSLAIADIAAFAELAYLHALLDSRAQRISEAVSHFEMALDALNSCAERGDRAYRALGDLSLDTHVRLAAHQFLLGDYSSAQSSLAQAEQPLATQLPMIAASIEWTHALIERWRGNLTPALQYALNANARYEATDTAVNHISHARLRIITADIVLDFAEQAHQAAQFTRSGRFLMLAQPLIRTARSYLHDTMDVAGEQLALLCFVRWRRLQTQTDDFRPIIEHVIRFAERCGDLPLLGQALTAMGQDLAARGEDESALNMYRVALDTLTRSQAQALQVWPRRALLRAQEMSA